MTRLLVKLTNPSGKLYGIGNRGGQEDMVTVVGQKNDRLLPYNTTLLVTHVMNFIKNYPPVTSISITLQTNKERISMRTQLHALFLNHDIA